MDNQGLGRHSNDIYAENTTKNTPNDSKWKLANLLNQPEDFGYVGRAPIGCP